MLKKPINHYLEYIYDFALIVFMTSLFVFLREETLVYWRLSYLTTMPILLFAIFRKKILVINIESIFQFLFLSLILVGLVYSINSSLTYGAFGRILRIFLFTFIINNYVYQYDKKKVFFISFIVAGLTLSIYLLLINIDQIFTLYRLSEEGLNANIIGLNITLSVLFLILLIESTGRKFIYLLALPLILVLLLTGSRKAILVMAFIAIYHFRFVFKKSGVLNITVLLVLTGIIAYFFKDYLVDLSVFDRLQNVISFLSGEGTAETSINYRVLMIEYGLEFFTYKPLLGHGMDTYRVLVVDLLYSTYSHNNFIEIMVGTGLVGLVVYYSRYILLFMSKSQRDYAFLSMLLLIILLVDNTAVTYDYKAYQFALSFIIFFANIDRQIFVKFLR